jgi:hypothetical protein
MVIKGFKTLVYYSKFSQAHERISPKIIDNSGTRYQKKRRFASRGLGRNTRQQTGSSCTAAGRGVGKPRVRTRLYLEELCNMNMYFK